MAIHDPARRAAMAVSSGPPFEPMALNRAAVGARSALKVAVLNVAGGAHLDSIVACLRRPPLAAAGTLLLCEASWRMPRHGLVEFAPALAAALKMSFAFLPSFGRDEGGGDFRAIGNALLCARPLDDLRVVRLPKSPFKFRARHLPGVNQGLLASINVAGRRVTIGVAHLERVWDPEGRALQMECLLSEIGREAPAIVGGDFNTTTMDMDRRWAMLRAAAAIGLRPRRFREPQPHEPLFDRIKEHGFSIEGANVPAVPTFTISRLVPKRWRPKLDWIAARGIQPVSGSAAVVPARTAILGRRVSDHDFVLCEFRLKE
jgi:endonuclease/exonuclease/phosphatase family metal-dependent hydrolase